jgi:PST family polysaccharide transporter
MDRELSSNVKKGYLWTLLGTGLNQAISFFLGIVLARLLSPAEFGIVAACLIFTEVASTLVSSSYVSALIQKPKVSPVDLSTGFVLQLTSALGVALLLVSGAPLVSRFMGDSTVGWVLSVLSVNAVLLAFASTPQVIARRNLDFRPLMLVTTIQAIAYGLVAVAMAWSGYGVWSLVVAKIVSSTVQAVFLCYAIGWRPSVRFEWSVAASLWKVSAQFGGKSVLEDLTRNADYLIVGWRLGVEPLGFYARAYDLMMIPISRLSSSLERVLFPAFSRIQDERDRLVRGLIKASCLISMTVFPILLGLQVVAPILIPVLYGSKWTPTVAPLQVICIAGLFYSLDPPALSLIHAKGYLKQEINRQIVHLVLMVIGVFGGAFWGTTGVAWAVVLAAFTHWLLLLHLLKRRIDLRLFAYLAALVPASLASLVMAVVVSTFQMGMADYIRPSGAVILVCSIVLGGVIYIGALWILRHIWDHPPLNEAFEEIGSLLPKKWSRTRKFFAVRRARAAV